MDEVASPAPRSEVIADRTLVAGSNALDASPALESARTSRRYQPLVVVTLAVASGIVCDRYGPRQILTNSGAGWFLFTWSSCACCLALWWILWQRRRVAIGACVLVVAAALAGATWHHLNWFLFYSNEVGRYAAYDRAPVCIEAVARGTPERVVPPPPTPLRAIPVGERSRLFVDVTRIRDGRNWRPASGICQVSCEGHLLGVRPGDDLRVFGQLSRIAPPLNPGEFDFAARARADGQLVRIRSTSPDSATTLAQGSRWTFTSLLDTARTKARRFLRAMIGQQHAGLASAILLGERGGLPYEETESYIVTGTVHVLVVSGMNVAILGFGLLGLIRMGLMPRRTGLFLITAIVIGYALLAESQPPVVRAAVLGVLMCVAAWIGRRGVEYNSLFGAALIVLAINPNDVFLAGTQLSFLAVATLVWIGLWRERRKTAPDRLDQMIEASGPLVVRLTKRGAKWLWLICCVMTSAVWLAVLPLVLYQFHVVSPIAILISPIVGLCVVVAMWSGFFMLLAGWIVPPLGTLCAAVCNWSLSGLESIVEWAEAAPVGHAWFPGPAWWWVLVFYVGLLIAMIWGTAVMPRRWQLASLACWILIGLVPAVVREWNRDALDCTFVAVGHGECVVLEAPTGETLLYDAGGIGSPEFATQSIASVLWDRGIMRIDGIVISHADIDHYNAVPGLLERFRVGTIYVSPVMFRSIGDANDGGPQVLRDAIVRAGVPIREIWSGDQLHVGPEVTVQVLHPPRKGVLGSDNANSITLGVEYAGRRILLPGDLESPGLEDVMAEQPYKCDVLLAPHHGSRRSDPPGFAAWSTPRWVVISGGSSDDFEPVVRTYERAGASVFVTNEAGATHFKLQPDAGVQLATWRIPNRSGWASSSRP